MSQADQILRHMKEHGSIDSLQALKRYDCFRLAARIYDLRCRGHEVDTQTWETRSGKKVARYWLRKKPRRSGATKGRNLGRSP